jgi:hypothetical protein
MERDKRNFVRGCKKIVKNAMIIFEYVLEWCGFMDTGRIYFHLLHVYVYLPFTESYFRTM